VLGVTAASPGGYRPDRPKVGTALTFKLDQSVGAGQYHSMAAFVTSQAMYRRRRGLDQRHSLILKTAA